jgi:hypothetical protein
MRHGGGVDEQAGIQPASRVPFFCAASGRMVLQARRRSGAASRAIIVFRLRFACWRCRSCASDMPILAQPSRARSRRSVMVARFHVRHSVAGRSPMDCGLIAVIDSPRRRSSRAGGETVWVNWSRSMARSHPPDERAQFVDCRHDRIDAEARPQCRMA